MNPYEAPTIAASSRSDVMGESDGEAGLDSSRHCPICDSPQRRSAFLRPWWVRCGTCQMPLVCRPPKRMIFVVLGIYAASFYGLLAFYPQGFSKYAGHAPWLFGVLPAGLLCALLVGLALRFGQLTPMPGWCACSVSKTRQLRNAYHESRTA